MLQILYHSFTNRMNHLLSSDDMKMENENSKVFKISPSRPFLLTASDALASFLLFMALLLLLFSFYIVSLLFAFAMSMCLQLAID